MGKKPKYDLVLFIMLMALGFMPMLQGWLRIFPTKPLNGVTVESEKPEFNLDTYRSGVYARQAEAYTSQHIGFREPIIRLYNEYLWDFYHKTYAHDIVAGKEGWLYYPQSVRDYYGQELLRWHPSVDEAYEKFNNEVKYMNWARSILKENGVDLLVFMAPEKSFLYPEFLPVGEKDTTTFNACDYFAQRFDETGFPCIEMTRWFQQMKDTVDYPLIPQAGAHWIFPSVYAVDTLSRLMSDLKGIELPKIKIGEAYHTRDADHDYDDDLELLLNLAFPMRHQYGYYPRHYVSVEQDSTCVKPKVLFIGNSYFWAMNLFAPLPKLFEKTEFWYYFSTAYSGDGLTETTSVDRLDFVEKLLDFDYVVWFTTGNQMNKGTSDFAEKAILNLCYSKKDIDQTYKRIIDSLALSTGASLTDSNSKQQLWSMANRQVFDHPERYFPELAFSSLPEIRNPRLKEVLAINDIKKDSVWMEKLSYQTIIQNARMEQVLEMEADNMLSGRPLLRDMEDPELRKAYVECLVHQKAMILHAMPDRMEEIKQKASLFGKTIDEQLQYDAAWSTHKDIVEGKTLFGDIDGMQREIRMYDYLASPAFESLVESIRQNMSAHPNTMKAIEEKAKQSGRTIEEQLEVDAHWVAKDKVQKGLVEY